MRQRLVLWGEIGTDRKALIAINFDEEERKIFINAFPKEEITKEIQDSLFQVWKNGGEYKFPSNSFYWEVNETDDGIPKEIKIHKPAIVKRSYDIWTKKLLSLRHFEAFQKNLLQIKSQSELKNNNLDTTWNSAKELWNKILSAHNETLLIKEHKELLKLNIDDVFNALKAKKRLNKENDFQFSLTNFKALNKKLDTCAERLIYPKEWNKTFNTLREIQQEVNDLPFMIKHERQLRKRINEIFKDFKKYKQTERENHLKSRIKNLSEVIKKLEKSISREEENYKMQYDKIVHYTRGRLSEKEIEERLAYIKDKIASSKNKIIDITKTIKSLKKKTDRKKDPQNEKTNKAISQNPEENLEKIKHKSDSVEKK